MPLRTNFEVKKCFRNKARFNRVYSKVNSPKINDGAYVINLDEYETVVNHQISLSVNGDNVTYFDSIGVELIPKEIKKFCW